MKHGAALGSAGMEGRRSALRGRLGENASLLLQTVRTFGRVKPMQLAAALSYYTVLSLAPIVLVSVAIAGLLFGREAVEGRVVEEIGGLVGTAGAEVIQTVLTNAAKPSAGITSLIIGAVSLLIGATTVFVQLQDAVNQIWKVEARTDGGAIRRLVKKRLLSIAMVMAVGFLLLVSLVLSAGLTALEQWASQTGLGSSFPLVLQIVNVLVSFVLITALFAMIFRYLPDVELSWDDVLFGAALTAALFTVGKSLIGLYLGRASIGSAYGAAGSLVAFLVWIYYAALILFFGFKLTQVRTERRRGKPAPEPHAVRVEPRAAPN